MKHLKLKGNIIIIICKLFVISSICVCGLKQTVSAAEPRIYTVNQDGTGDYTSIMEGVETVSDGDTLLLYPGIYNEYVNICDKTVNILGVDKELCIIQSDTADYEQVPLFVAAGKISNVTVYGVHKKSKEYYSGYAIHIEQDYLYGRDLCFENCKIISENNYCVGLGCRGESSVSFIECDFVSMGYGGAMYFHDYPTPEYGGESRIIMKNCKIYNFKNPYYISAQSFYEQNRVYITFQNVKVHTVAYDEKDLYRENNMCSGVTVDEIISLQNSIYNPVMIYNLDRNESQNFIMMLNEKNALQVMPEILKEGITFLHLQEQEVKNEEGYTVFITNVSEETQNGWCGLDQTFLTEDSFGNTFQEMNYIVVDNE